MAWTQPIYIILKKKKKKTVSINTHFSNPKSLKSIHSHPLLPSRLPFSPSPSLSLSLSLEQDRCYSLCRSRYSLRTSPRQRSSILHLTSLSSLHPSPCRNLQKPLLLPYLASPSSTSQGCNTFISLTSWTQAFAMKIVLFVQRIKFKFSSLSAIFVE